MNKIIAINNTKACSVNKYKNRRNYKCNTTHTLIRWLCIKDKDSTTIRNIATSSIFHLNIEIKLQFKCQCKDLRRIIIIFLERIRHFRKLITVCHLRSLTSIMVRDLLNRIIDLKISLIANLIQI